VVLFPTWLAGTTQELMDLGFVGPGKIVNSSRYFVVAVDAFGNGVSSSPSTSKLQPGALFPRFSVRDMVDAQYALLSRHLGLTGIYAIFGVSMGAMQAFEWIVSYPQFITRAVAVSGTPHLTPYDRLVWNNEIRILATVSAADGGKTAMRTMLPVHHVMSKTPEYFARMDRNELMQLVSSLDASSTRYNTEDWKSQVQAILGHSVFRQFGGSEEKAASAVRARTLVVAARQDGMVYPGPAKSFARRLGAETAELAGDCGHLAAFCEKDQLREIVHEFLESKQGIDSSKWKRQLLFR
jgi:homoserine O-acetyltransferase